MKRFNKSQYETCGKIAQRLFNLLRLQNPPTSTYEGDTVTDVILDLEHVNDVCPISLDRLYTFPDGDFLHDMSGIYRHFNRTTKQLDDCFCPRSAKPKTNEPKRT